MTFFATYSGWQSYGRWLVNRVHFNKPGYEYLMECLHNIDFEYYLERDGNRAEDGLMLRDEFGYDMRATSIPFTRGCSVLEMLVAFAIRIDDEYIGDPKNKHPEKIFWEMLCNLGLQHCTDNSFDPRSVRRVVDRWLKRDFDADGYGSIFPLKRTTRDQTLVEIWSQMNEYLTENYSF